MSSPTTEAQRLDSPRSWRGTATYVVTLAFRIAIIAVALWAVRFTIEREHAWASVEDYHHCAPAMGATGQGFAFGCGYEDVSVSPSLMQQSYRITAPDGASIQTRIMEPTWWNNSIGVERKTASTWLLYVIAAFALAPTLWMSVLGEIGLRLPARLKLGRRYRFLLMALTICALAALFAPFLREMLAMHRIESSELKSEPTDVKSFATGVQTTIGGDLTLLGSNTYDTAARVAGIGCRLYTDDGNPIPRSAFPVQNLVKLSTLPTGTRFVGLCFFPDYNHALGSS